VGGDIGQALKLATTILPFLKRGGGVDNSLESGRKAHPIYNSPDAQVGSAPPFSEMARMLAGGGTVQHFDDGGDVNDDAKMPFSMDPVPTMSQIMSHMKPNPFAGAGSTGNIDWGMLNEGIPTPTGQATPFKDRFNSAFPQMGTSAPAPSRSIDAGEVNPHPVQAGSTPLPRPYPGPGALGAKTDAVRIDEPGKPAADDEEEAPAGTTVTAGKGKPAAASSDISQYMQPRAQQPYPNALYQDKGQVLAKSPWMALIKAGATMMSTPGSLGTGIGKGILAGTGSLDSQRKELRSEQELNQKASQLYQDAQIHLDKYNKMTPSEAGNLAARNREIDQAADSGTNADFKPAEINQVIRAINEKPENIAKVQSGNPADTADLQRQYAAELAHRKALRTGQAAAPVDTGPGSSATNPLPAPGAGQAPVVGKFYKLPDGTVRQWGG
jgi:hypothetical protein